MLLGNVQRQGTVVGSVGALLQMPVGTVSQKGVGMVVGVVGAQTGAKEGCV